MDRARLSPGHVARAPCARRLLLACLQLVALGASSPATAATSFVLDLSADGDGGRGTLLGIANDGERWGWHLDLAHSRADAAPDGTSEAFSADDLGLGLAWRSDVWSVALDLDRWQDSNDLESVLWTARLGWQHEDWLIEFVPRFGTVATELPDPTSSAIIQREYERSALGLALAHDGRDWSWWLEGAAWDYSPDIDISSNALVEELTELVDLQVLVGLIRNGQSALVGVYLTNAGATELLQVLQTQGLTGLQRVVRFQARRVQYATSLHTFALGLSDATLRAGLERRYGAGALSFEYEQLEIPVDALQASSWSLRWRWPVTAALEATVSAGLVDTESYGSTGYAGLTLRWLFD